MHYLIFDSWIKYIFYQNPSISLKILGKSGLTKYTWREIVIFIRAKNQIVNTWKLGQSFKLVEPSIIKSLRRVDFGENCRTTINLMFAFFVFLISLYSMLYLMFN